jgi:hypothetical protein
MRDPFEDDERSFWRKNFTDSEIRYLRIAAVLYGLMFLTFYLAS